MMNEIRIAKNGNMTICGGHAHTLYFKMRDELAKMYDPVNLSAFIFVLDVKGEMIAAECNTENAKEHMRPDRIMVIKERN